MKFPWPSVSLKKKVDLGGGEDIGVEAAYDPAAKGSDEIAQVKVAGKGDWETAGFWRRAWRKLTGG